MSESSGNAERFLKAIDKIESELREKAKAAPDVDFSELLKACNWNNRVVRVNMVLLQSLSEVRRAILIKNGGKQILLATPSDNTVSEAERMADLLSRHFSVLDYASKPVQTISADDSALTAFERMKELHTSKFPVYQGSRYVGFITMEAIAFWCMEGKSASAPVSQVLAGYAQNDVVLFLGKDRDAQDALSAYSDLIKKGSNLMAVIVTENGSPSEPPLGLLTVSDMPAIMAAYN